MLKPQWAISHWSLVICWSLVLGHWDFARAAAPPTTQDMYQIISRGPASGTYQAFPDICRVKNGDLLCVFYAGYGHVSLEADDFPNGGRICMTRSSDDGHTWSQPAILFDDPDDNRDPHIAQLDDGSLLCTFFSWHHKGPRYKSIKDFTWKSFHENAIAVGASFVRSRDGGQTWEKSANLIASGWFCSAPVRQLPDGTCLLGLYSEEAKTRNYRPGVVRSSDRFKTWDPPIRIPTPPGAALPAETDIIRLSDGRLYAALRGEKIHMHYSISADEGKTWSIAQDIGFDGHCPHFNRLSTGQIILSHRLPHTSIHISSDECKSWQGPYEIDSCIGAYPSTVELKDHTVLIVYYTEGGDSHIRARRFRVIPDGIEFLPPP
jgi:sialidase-1